MAEESEDIDDDLDEESESESEPDFLGEAAAALDDLSEWGGDDLEQAYLKAMSALEASDLQIPMPPSAAITGGDETETDHDSQQVDIEPERQSASPKRDLTAEPVSEQAGTPTPSIAELFAAEPELDEAPVAETPVVEEARLTPRQIIEACLFVGGSPLTSKRLATVLRGEIDGDYVDREINELNRQYAAEGRPYEIRLGDGGYRMSLREEFERIRHKVYGLGPKEVRLSQDALEVLAVVAYHQPIQQAQVEELGKPGCGAVLRQLVRRELIAVERDPAKPREVSYKTTPRFLSLFGISSLDELPRHEQVSYK